MKSTCFWNSFRIVDKDYTKTVINISSSALNIVCIVFMCYSKVSDKQFLLYTSTILYYIEGQK